MFKLIALGGTFDRLHQGHKFFLSLAFQKSQRVLIGLTSDQYTQKKLNASRLKLKAKIEKYQVRKETLSKFLKRKGVYGRAEIVKIDDVYGSALERGEIEALLVTSETLKGARLINRKRKQLGLPLLKIIVAPNLLAKDKKRISSLRIRKGEINRQGQSLNKIKIIGRPISEDLRQELKKPLGILVKGDPQNPTKLLPKLKKMIDSSQPTMIITVGDEVTKFLNEAAIFPNLAVIDYKVARKKKYHTLRQLGFAEGLHDRQKGRIFIVRNHQGLVSKTLIMVTKKVLKMVTLDRRQRIIRVLGEEDLAALLAILLSPLNSLVLYGQPEEGIVLVKITEEKKQQVFKQIC